MCFFIRRGSRQVFLADMTTNPTWAWVTQCHEVSVPAQRDRQLGEEVPEAPAGSSPATARDEVDRRMDGLFGTRTLVDQPGWDIGDGRDCQEVGDPQPTRALAAFPMPSAAVGCWSAKRASS